MARGMYVLCEIEGVLANASHRKSVSDADAGQLIAGDELIFPTSRMLRGFARSGAEVVLISSRSETLEAPTKRWLKDFALIMTGFISYRMAPVMRSILSAH